jgi:putative DNA primase/helicase
VNKIVNIASENEVREGGFNSEYFKAIATGDQIRVERKFHEGFSYSPLCKLMFAMNALPFSKDRSHGFHRRLIIIPFEKRFEKGSEDKDLANKLEQELPGILNFALDGLKRLRANKYTFTESEAIERALNEYKEVGDPFFSFVSEMIVEEAGSKVTNETISWTFKSWCERNGRSGAANMNHQKLVNSLRAELINRGIVFQLGRNGSRGRYIEGIKLQTDLSYAQLVKKPDLTMVDDIDEMD